jgi:type IV pilus secretin PilQ/predicted competence protein
LIPAFNPGSCQNGPLQIFHVFERVHEEWIPEPERRDPLAYSATGHEPKAGLLPAFDRAAFSKLPFHPMSNPFKHLFCGAAALLAVLAVCNAQTGSPAPLADSPVAAPAPLASDVASQPKTSAAGSLPTAVTQPADKNSLTVVQASGGNTVSSPAGATKPAAGPGGESPEANPAVDSGGVAVREFQGDDIGQVLRLLARQAKVNMVVSDAVQGTVTMRLEDVTALQSIEIIVKAKGLFMDKIDNVYYIKTAAEKTAEPTESDSYQFSYARAKDVSALIAPQLSSKEAAQVDERTNTLFFRETRSNIDNIRKLLLQLDKPTKQVMIEARLVEVTANPRQSYGINWSGVFGGSTNPQTFRFAGSQPGTPPKVTVNPDGSTTTVPGDPPQGKYDPATGKLIGSDFFFDKFLNPLAGQFAILSAPQMAITTQLLNEDADAEFLAHPRVVTADNMQAKIEITRAQPVPSLTFNNQTGSYEFQGFTDKKYGNNLVVKPSVNKDNFITLGVKPEISNKVSDVAFTPNGASSPILSPVIDTRSLDSNVLIKSGDTLAIGGLLQDETLKSRTKVPVVGDVPILGYLFQSRGNTRTKRNLLVFVTPTIIDQRYGTGLEDQVSGVHHSGDEFADPNGWRNNAKGAVRLVPTSNRQNAADYPKPGTPPAPARRSGGTSTSSASTDKVQFLSSARDRDL